MKWTNYWVGKFESMKIAEEKKCILITGVTGFLGSHLSMALVKLGYRVIGIKRRTSFIDRITDIQGKIELIDIEDVDYKTIFDGIGHVDVIIHTATCYGRNGESVLDIFKANAEFPLALLDAGVQAGINVFINTDTVLDKYLNLYSLSKNQFLQWGVFFSRNKKINFCNLKLQHFFGAGDDNSKFTTSIINSCLNNIREINLTAGEQTRDFIYIDDVISAYLHIIDSFYKFNSPFVEIEVGSGTSISIRDFVGKVKKLTGADTSLNFGSIPYRDGEVMHSQADVSILESIGWRCRYNLEEALKLTLEGEKK